jgi:hypothetical protein
MPGICLSCSNWKPILSDDKIRMGRCKPQNRMAAAGYSCADWHPTVAGVNTLLGLTEVEIEFLRTDHSRQADSIRDAWRWVWREPFETRALEVFHDLMERYRGNHFASSGNKDVRQ